MTFHSPCCTLLGWGDSPIYAGLSISTGTWVQIASTYIMAGHSATQLQSLCSESRDKIPGAHCPASLAEPMSYSFSEKTSLRYKVKADQERHLMPTSDLHLHAQMHTITWTCTYIPHTYIHTKRKRKRNYKKVKLVIPCWCFVSLWENYSGERDYLRQLQRTAVHPGDRMVEIHGGSDVCQSLFTWQEAKNESTKAEPKPGITLKKSHLGITSASGASNSFPK